MYSSIDVEEIEQPTTDNSRNNINALHQNHTRSTFTDRESRLLKFIRYTRFSSLCWLTYLIPATPALIIALFVDSNTSISCNKLFGIWAIVQIIIQVCNILFKSTTFLFLLRFPALPEPRDIEAFGESNFFALLTKINRVMYFLWFAWFVCGTVWVMDTLLFSDCELGILFDVILTLIIMQILFICGGGLLCCCATLLVGIRILQIVVRLSTQDEQGIMGYLNTGATKEVIQTNTETKTFTSELMESSNAM